MISWLHLSDWHQKNVYNGNLETTSFGRREFLDKLLYDIRNRTETVSPSLSKVDFVVFSGDLAHSGQREEYNLALKDFIRPVLEAADVEPENLFIVPGNHDVDRGKLSLPQEGTVKAIFYSKHMEEFREMVSNTFSNLQNKEYFLGKFDNFKKMLIGDMECKYLEYDPRYFYRRTFKHDDRKVSIICMNFSWLSGYSRDENGNVNDYGRLSIGEMQIKDAFRNLPTSDLVIVIAHHPFPWLAEHESNRIEELVCRDSQIFLHGHQHIPRVNISRSTDGDVVVIPAGAAFQERFPRDTRNISSYNFASVDFERKSGTVFLRRWNDKMGKYTSDSDIWTDGEFPFVLPELDRKDHAYRRKAMHQIEVTAAPYLDRKFSSLTKVKLSHSIIYIEDFQVVEQHTVYTRDLKGGREPNFFLESWSDPFIVSEAKRRTGIEPHTHRKLLIGEEEVKPDASSGNVRVERALNREPINIHYEYTCQHPILGVDTTNANRFTEELVLTINKAPELEYEVSGLGGLIIHKTEMEKLGENCDQYKLKRLIFPHQGIRVSWHPKHGIKLKL